MTAASRTAGNRRVVLREEPPLATVGLRDVSGRNRISPPLRTGLLDALRRVAENPEIRVVVLEGLPDIFCAGASIDRMLGRRRQRSGEVWELLRSILDCPVPVLAAARGHALGGGFLLALYCDVTVLSERSRYSANFLPYGFTPTLGATYLLPSRLGQALGSEMLYTGRGYRGRELAERGAGVQVVGHDDVAAVTVRTALSMAGAPRRCLELLKAQLAAPVRAAVTAAFEIEEPDHEATITSAEARQRIRTLHGERLERAHAEVQP